MKTTKIPGTSKPIKTKKQVWYDQTGRIVTDKNEIQRYLDLAIMPPKRVVNIIDWSIPENRAKYIKSKCIGLQKE